MNESMHYRVHLYVDHDGADRWLTVSDLTGPSSTGDITHAHRFSLSGNAELAAEQARSVGFVLARVVEIGTAAN